MNNMKHLFSNHIFIFLGIICGIFALIAYAQQDSLKKPCNKYFSNESIETAFFVRSKALCIIIGSSDDCKMDNRFIRDALKNEDVDIANSNYDVLVKKSTVGFTTGNDKEPLTIYQYFVDFRDCNNNKIIEKYIKELGEKEHHQARDLAYKFPVTCYYFAVKGKLVLLCHYGLASYYSNMNPELLIEYVKKMCENGCHSQKFNKNEDKRRHMKIENNR